MGDADRRSFSLLLKARVDKHDIQGIYEVGEMLRMLGIDINTLDRYNYGMTALMHAATYREPDMVRALCELGADVNAVDDGHGTALSHAALQTNTACVIELCRQPGIDPNIRITAREFRGETPLMYACWKCEPSAVRALIDCGADLNAAKEVGDRFTPLMFALNNRPRAARNIVEMLLEAGADPEALDSGDRTIFNQHRWEGVRTAGPGKNLPTGTTYRARKRALAAGKARSNALQKELNLKPPYGKEFVAIQSKYNEDPRFRTVPLTPTNLSLVRNIIGGGPHTRRSRKKQRNTRRR